MFENLLKLRGELTSTQEIVLGIAGFLLFILSWWGMAELLAVRDSVQVKDGISADQVEDPRYITNFDFKKDTVYLKDQGGMLMGLSDEEKAAEYAEYLFSTEYEKVKGMPSAELERYGLEKGEKKYAMLPPPGRVLNTYSELILPEDVWEESENGDRKEVKSISGRMFSDRGLLPNTGKSIMLNLFSYFIAVLIALPLGFLLGLIPLVRGLFNQVFDSMRFVPLVAVPGLFAIWFGYGTTMKVAFLASGILVYLVPVVVQRIDEVKEVYLKTVFTLGATTWQTIKTVYLPSVLSRVSDDVRVLTAISWTYITVAEMLKSEGGIGSMIFKVKRSSGEEATFAILIVIVIIGISQDWILKQLDKLVFPFKYQERGHGR